MVEYCNIDIIIATLNSEKVLKTCLDSIKKQDYPKNKIHLYISDGFSTDNTLKIAKKYQCQIINNPLKTAEAAKAIALNNSNSELVSFIDSDNILPNKNFLKQLILPLISNNLLIGTEPIAFTYRKNAGFIERYSALIGANDPYAFFIGVSDRRNYINNKWTGINNLNLINHSTYTEILFNKSSTIPTIGANGTIFRRKFLSKLNIDKYLFDIDLLSQYINKYPKSIIHFAKVDNSIIHTYCESSIIKFIKKQKRRVLDLLEHKQNRQYSWNKNQFTFLTLVKSNFSFSLYSILIIPSLIDALRGYFHKPDMAWFFHPFACFITFIIYSYYLGLSFLGVKFTQSRSKWSQ